MATCADCVHVGVCSEYVEGLAAARGLKLKTAEEISAILQCDDCEHFQDRARFVELPCRVSGDCFFINQNGTIQRATLERVYMFSTSTELFLNDGREIYSTSLNESNRELFPTYEEAEQALKERETNE